MSTLYVGAGGLDLNRQQLLNARVQNLAAAPASPAAGLYYFDTVLGHLYVWNGSGWEQASGGGGSGTVTSVGLSMPSVFAIAGTNPVTSAGTLAVTFAGSQTANQVLATPAVAGAVALRTIDHNYISDFDTQVRTSRLDQMAAPTASVSLNSQKITNLLNPTAAQDAATKNYVDVTIQGLTPKPTATVATTAALPASTYANGTSGVGATLTGNANGALTVDGYAVAAGDRVLVKDQATGAQNGLYDVTQAGSAGAPFILTRNVDMDTAAEFPAAFIPVEDAGTVNANSLWLCTNSAQPTVGTTAIIFTELNKAADLLPGTGISIAGNTVSISATYAGQASIVTLGTVTTGTWQGTTVAVNKGGTGATTAAGARAGIGAAGKYQATIGNASATSFTITQATHGLAADSSILVQVLDDTSGAVVLADVSVNKATGDVTVTFGAAPATNQYRVILLG